MASSPFRIFLTIVAVGIIAAVLFTYPTTLDWSNVPSYRRGLICSLSPRAFAIRRHIANGPADLAREQAAATAEGIPLSLADLHLGNLPADRNAADDYRDIGQVWRAGGDAGEFGIITLAAKWRTERKLSPADRAELRRLLAASPTLRRVHATILKPVCIPQGMDGPERYGYLGGMGTAARLLRAESLSLALDGRFEDAVRNEALGYKVARHAYQAPIRIGYLVANACQAVTTTGYGDLLQIAGPNETLDRLIVQSFQASVPHPKMSDTLKIATVSLLETNRRARDLDPEDLREAMTPPTWRQESFRLPGLRPPERFSPAQRHFVNDLLDGIAAAEIHAMREAIRTADQPERPDKTSDDPADRRATPKVSDDPIDAAVAAQMPTFQRGWDRRRLVETQERCLVAAAAVLAFKARTGSYPVWLEDAIPETPMDPMTGRPLSYARRNGGFVISAGRPGSDFGSSIPIGGRFQAAQFRYPEPGQPEVRPRRLDRPGASYGMPMPDAIR